MKAEQSTGIRSFIRHLVTAIANASLYHIGHQQVNRLCAVALAKLEETLGADSEISFLLIEDELVVEGIPLPDDMYTSRFGRAIKSFGIGHVRFLRGVAHRELLHLIDGLAKQNDCLKKISSTKNIRFGKVEVRSSGQGDGTSGAGDTGKIPTAEDIPPEKLSVFKEINEGIRKNQRLNVAGIGEIVAAFVDTFKDMTHPFLALASLRARDEYTFTHSSNVCILNLAQAMSLGIEGPPLYEIGIAALLHDIGKLFVPDDILNKPGRLDEAEMEMIRQHPAKGALYLLDIPGIPRLAVITAFEHHMKFDYSGYPRVASGWRQNLCSQMTMISDFFDALRTKRTYRDAMEYDEIAEKMLERAGTEFNPALTENFLHLTSTLQTNH